MWPTEISYTSDEQKRIAGVHIEVNIRPYKVLAQVRDDKLLPVEFVRALHARGDYRMALRAVAPHDQHQIRLYHGAGLPYAGALYSWVMCSTDRQLANKLADQWQEPLTEEEWEVIEQLSVAETEVELACDGCGGSGVDPGGLRPNEAEDCPSCGGSGLESSRPMLARRPAGHQVVSEGS